ncbi:Protocadherin Fat 4-like [Oopsacas minuta]|uniref:Protocadherin Fat 4-like n=1 Tax=Oopsacas minuta TaxID=111878 RepID=A0AAV7JX85_9METZ|nr:Protocadherin Fat 4-like [Oopsacas minuta]
MYIPYKVYFLKLTCSDNAPSPCTVTTTLTITSADSNISPPQFSSPFYNITLSESVTVLDAVFIAVATDTDLGTNGMVSYSINDTVMFSIDSVTGVVYLSHPLDFESSISHTLIILATDGTPLSPNRKSSSALLNIYVTDINDNRPYCGATLFTVLFPGTAGIGYSVIQLNCTDPDLGLSGLSYTLSGDVMNLFDISIQGLITLATTLTTDVNISTLIVSVSDNFIGDSVQITNVTIMIVLTGQNDFCPEFSQANYSTNLTESSPPGELVITVHAEDRDAEINGAVRYSIINGDNMGHFAVRESTGEIILISSLDRESIVAYSLLITASDNGLPPCTNSTVVTIIITDSNDNKPCFSQPFYTETVPLNTPIDSIILSVASQDMDLDSNSQVFYSLISVNSPEHFSIHHTSGDINLTYNLSNSSVELYQFLIEATDNGMSSLSCSSYLTIYTQHMNVFPPVFDHNEFVSISENITPLITLLYVAASDRDSEYLHYSIVSENEDYLFYLHPDTGALSLRRQLDYEQRSVHSLIVEARDVVLYDGISLADTSEVTISVRNENDNIPCFEYNSYSITIDSTAGIGDELLTIVCTDLDMAPYGNTTLSISDGNNNGYFSVAQAGVISIAQDITELKYEILTVTCSDGELSVNTTVLIIATSPDVPQFSRDTYEWYLVENSQLGTSYTEISASSNSTVTYSILTGDYTHVVVYIDSAYGIVHLINTVDRELVTDYIYIISALSDDIISYSTLHIIVTDDNDNRPVIFIGPVALLYSYSPPDSVVTFLSCQDSDIDSNGLTNLIINAGNEDGLFVLSPEGALQLNRTLGSESVYSLVISCYDSGLPSLSTTASINVEIAPVNRYSPEFEYNQLVVDVLENEFVNDILVTLIAVDRDEGTFGDISYSILSGNELNLFRINPITGEFTLEYPLDFESVQTHTLTVAAIDGGYGEAAARYSTADVIIRVLDVNDNSPHLDSDIYSLHISFTTAPGIELLRTVCTDTDSGNNGETEYYFVNDSAPFYVSNGSIFLAFPLEYSFPDSVCLVLECRDRGSPPLVTSSLLRIYITKDELAPEFNQSIYSLTLFESTELFTDIITITAEDRDPGNNGIVSLLLTDCEYDCPFSINTVTGVVSVIGALDYETHPTYSLQVQALDLGTFSHTSEATIEIQIINENDNFPEFNIPFHQISISENSPINTPVLSLLCYDLDSDELSYAITDGLQGTNAFYLSEHGVLLVSDIVDYETIPSYSLTVQCSDGLNSVYSSVQVRIININEYTPTFNQSNYNISLLESLTFGSIIFTVTAVDRDADSLGDITYTLVGGNTQLTFGIQSTEGIIFLTDSLDYETTPTYSLILFATDGDGLIGRTSVLIKVINVNDNAPVFMPSIYSRELSIDQEVNVNVIELRCSDRDGDDLVYNIESGNTGSYFNISQTGLVFVARNLTRSNQVLILKISCSDRSTKPSAVAIFSINIIREADCPIQFANNVPYIDFVSEDVSIHHLVLTLFVNGSSNDVSYHIDNTFVPFYINSIGTTGQILVSSALDADIEDEYIFNVIATPNDVLCNDPPQTSVTIFIEDVNEFSPLVTPAIQTIYLEENLSVPQLIAQFQCNDSDASNNEVTFIDGSAGIDTDIAGRVTLSIGLDYETQPQHIFMIMCKDSADIPKTGTARLHIMVIPQNEFPPIFSLDTYLFQVSESEQPGFLIDGILATDGDSLLSGDGQVSYSLTNTYQFLVNDNGDMVVIDALDREYNPNITFIATATDNGNVSMSASATIVVILLDSNDNPPLFHPLVYSISRDSNQSITDPLAAISCTDPDIGINALLELSFPPGFNLSYAFSDQTGGQGEINASLIALSPPSEGVLTFDVHCTDSGNMSLFSTALVSIVISSECYIPQLFPIYHATISEDSVINSVVVNTSAQFDPLCPHEFFIVSGEIGAFAINKTKGDIYVLSSLDFETIPAYEIGISLISLTATGAKSSTATVFITITNVNDNSPVIEPSRLIVTYPEDTHNNQVIASYSCEDLDSDLVQFDIESGNEDLRFNLNGQGVLTLLNPLDYENIQVHDLFISCAELGGPGILHTTTAELTVLVSAVNDNEPSFDQTTYFDTVIENTAIGTMILLVSATDNDLTTPHNKTLFDLSGANSQLFLVTSEGNLLTADFLDAETNSGLYQFSVLAYNPEPGASTATATVIITLTDVNEDPPVCGGGLINLELDPGTYSTEAVGSNLLCTDQDISPPSFTATLTGDINNDGTLILTAELSGSSLSLKLSGTINYPQHVIPNQYTLAVSDGGSPALIGYTLVYVRVNPPPGVLSFSPSSRSISVREDFPSGEDLIDVGAFLNGDNKDLADYSTAFPLTVTSEGMVALTSSLDYETRTSYSIDIRAEVSSQFNIFTLNIQVEDVNDNEPVFSAGNIIRFSVREDSNPSAVGTIRATDADSGVNGDVRFTQISSTAPIGLFTVSLLGMVRLTGPLDREDTPHYSIQVRASDQGSPSLSAVAVLLITVSDVNDNPPIFLEDSSGITLSIAHTIAKDSVIYNFQVSDLDLNPTFILSVIGGSSVIAAFGVSNTGELFIRDDLVNRPSQTFEFTVQVSDGVLTDSISVRILVNIVSDVELTLRENSPIDTVIWNASDYSQGSYSPTENAEFFLTLGNFQNTFSIDSTSGQLSTIGEIDYEDVIVYTFIVEIMDSSNTINTNLKVAVYLLVLDENDNNPVFTQTISSVTILESDYILPYKLAQVSAVDADSGVYAQLEYHLVYPVTGQEATELPFYFTFDGSLYVQGDVDRELYSLLDLLVRVRDKSQDPLSTTTPIQISVLDINDNSPSFVNLTSPIEIINNLPDNSVFYEFYISDPDAAENGTLQLSLEQITTPNSLYFDFNLDQATGLVRLIKIDNLIGLSEDELFFIDLRLSVSDQGSPQLSHTQDIMIAVKPYDIRPSFQSDFYWVDLLYSAPVGSVLLTVQLDVKLDSITFLIG